MLSVISVTGMPLLHHLPGRQPRTLQERPGLVGNHRDALAGLDRRADHAQRRAVSGRGQRARVAMRQHARTVGEQRRAMLAHGAIHRDVFGQDLVGLGQQRVGLRRHRIGRQRLPLHAHALERPEQIDGGGPAGRQHVETALQCVVERRARCVAMPQSLQRHAIGCCAADGGRAAHHHLANALRDRRGAVIAQVSELRRQHALVDHFQVAVAPAQRLDPFGLRRCHGCSCCACACWP